MSFSDFYMYAFPHETDDCWRSMGIEQAESLDPGEVKALGSRKPLAHWLSTSLGTADSPDWMPTDHNSELHSRYTATYI